jgi:tetratricopeptide (TPR) repeat protein
MSMEIGLNSEIEVSKRKLHLQTSYSADTQKASVSVFDGGVLVFRSDFSVSGVAEDVALEHKVRLYHDLVKADIELLFHMAEKVRDSKHLPSIKHLGHLFFEKGFFFEAIEQFECVKSADETDSDVDFELAKAYYKQGDYESAYRQLTSAAGKKPAYPDIQLLMAKVFWHLKKFDQARSFFQKAAKMNERYWDAYFSQAVCLVESTIDDPAHPDLPPPIERLKEAESLFRKGGRLAADIDHELLETGLEKLKLGTDVEEALNLFERARKEETTGRLFDSEFYLKFMFGQLDDDSQTLDYYIQTISNVLSENPDYADLRQSLGVAYILKGWQCFSRATGEFEKAVKINPEYEKAKKKLKLMQNDGRGLLILLRAVLN